MSKYRGGSGGQGVERHRLRVGQFGGVGQRVAGLSERNVGGPVVGRGRSATQRRQRRKRLGLRRVAARLATCLQLLST